MPSLPSTEFKSTSCPPYPDLSFITFSDPTQSRLPHQRRAVRSHAASYQHQLDKASAGRQALETPNRPRRRKQVIVALEVNSSAQFDQANGNPKHKTPSPISMLGEGRVDPFRSYPVPWEPFLPELIDHCKYCFTVAGLPIFYMFYDPAITHCSPARLTSAARCCPHGD